MIERINISKNSEAVRDKILCFLHYRYARSEDIVFTEEELSEVILDIKPRLLHFALTSLQGNPLAEIERVGEVGEFVDGFAISTEGIQLVDGWEDDYYEEISKGIDFLPDDESSSASIPASDRVVSLDHNSKEYKETVATLDAAAEAIRGFNGETTYDKKQIENELSAARILLKSTKVRVAAMAAVALAPLYAVLNDIVAEALKPVVLQAIAAIKALLGI